MLLFDMLSSCRLNMHESSIVQNIQLRDLMPRSQKTGQDKVRSVMNFKGFRCSGLYSGLEWLKKRPNGFGIEIGWDGNFSGYVSGLQRY
jgi:hypothetical protein